jgi:hypothetical protein
MNFSFIGYSALLLTVGVFVQKWHLFKASDTLLNLICFKFCIAFMEQNSLTGKKLHHVLNELH